MLARSIAVVIALSAAPAFAERTFYNVGGTFTAAALGSQPGDFLFFQVEVDTDKPNLGTPAAGVFELTRSYYNTGIVYFETNEGSGFLPGTATLIAADGVTELDDRLIFEACPPFEFGGFTECVRAEYRAPGGGVLTVPVQQRLDFSTADFPTGTFFVGGRAVATLTSLEPSDLAAIPEPASWAMMVTGFALVGGAVRGRRVTATA